jgi:hypothetical protein
MTRRSFALSLTGAPGAVAFGADTTKDRGRQLVDKIIYALGGDAFRNMRTRTEIGRAYSFYREQLTGLSVARIYTRYRNSGLASENDATALHESQRQVFGKKQDDAVIFFPTEAYEVTFRGAKPLADDRVKQFRETTLHDVFYILRARLNEPGVEFEAGEKDVVENQPVQLLDIYDAEDRKTRVWINSDTFLPVKQSFRRWDPVIKDWRDEVTRYSKYREVTNRVMWPFATERERDTEKIFEMYSESVTVDDPLPDSFFQLPNGIKILKK